MRTRTIPRPFVRRQFCFLFSAAILFALAWKIASHDREAHAAPAASASR